MASADPAGAPAAAGLLADTAQPTTAGRIDGLILAGGQSFRMRTSAMPDVDKGLRNWRGRPLVAWVCQYMQDQGVAHLHISANRHSEAYAVYGHVVPDAADLSHSGPLAGVLAGLQQASSPWLFILPVDVLRWPPDLLARLTAAATPDHPAYARTPDGPHPLCLVAHASLAGGLRDFVQSGRRQVQAWLQDCGAQPVDFSGEDCLVNLNTPQDWDRWMRRGHGPAAG
ncbi:MAG: molybdenum cofactor guanylyltransferase [Castellaniella sp.]|uniref:molybdenum cofactor guanylyltransferase n=1 Tax=Castellaniella sp. TaxID=1955812 RepID=UPI003C76758A